MPGRIAERHKCSPACGADAHAQQEAEATPCGEPPSGASACRARRQCGAALSPFVGQRLRPLASTERQEDLLYLKDVIEAGKVTPVISRTYPLDEAAKALSDADEGHGRGKVVITI